CITAILPSSSLFFCTATATPPLYTLSLHDALPIFGVPLHAVSGSACPVMVNPLRASTMFGAPNAMQGPPVTRHVTSPTSRVFSEDRKSTRLNSSHRTISYAVFCLKKKKKTPEASRH